MSEHTITELLSPAFLSRMQNMLGDEYESFLKSYEAPRTYGLRVNTAKISCDEFERIVPFPVTPIPWISNGYFYPSKVFLSGRCPSIFLSTLSGRTFLSAGTKCHDTGILSSSHSR